MIRPSNSGMATPRVTSSGDRPAARASHASVDPVATTAWSTGTPSGSSGESQPSPRPTAPGVARPHRAAGGPGRRHHGVGVAQQVEHRRWRPVRPRAQRVAVHGPGVGATGLDGIAELVDRQRVAGHDVGPVGHDRHGGPGRVVGARSSRPTDGRSAGGWKPKPSSRTVSATKRRRLARLTGPR